MNIEKYTDRVKGFIQSAQSLALREGHQQFSPLHILKVLLDDSEGLAGGLIDRAGGNSRAILQATEQALAKLPNVAVKLTGGPFYADDAYPFRSLHTHYRALYDAFGPRRLFWGTDITKMPCSWRECVAHFQEIDWMPEADKTLIMGDAICDWIGWRR